MDDQLFAPREIRGAKLASSGADLLGNGGRIGLIQHPSFGQSSAGIKGFRFKLTHYQFDGQLTRF